MPAGRLVAGRCVVPFESCVPLVSREGGMLVVGRTSMACCSVDADVSAIPDEVESERKVEAIVKIGPVS